jgi:DNA repair protein RadC
MRISSYERPREKLYKHGVAALTNAELLQVIIGSGNAGMPVTKIARKVDRLLKLSGTAIPVSNLIAVPGLGLIKAGQIVAGFELASRLAYEDGYSEPKESDILSDLYADIRVAKKRTLLYAFFDGNGRLIDDHSQTLELHDNTSQVVRKLFAEALSQSTASVLVAIGYESQPLEPTMFELSLARDVYSTAKLLSIPVRSFILLNAFKEHVVKEANRE